MKKLLGIVVLGLLLSGNAYADKIVHICKDIRSKPILKSLTLTLDKNARKVTVKQLYSDEYLNNNNITSMKSWTREYQILKITDSSVRAFLTNYKRWKDNHNWVVTARMKSKTSWDVSNPKTLKKLIKAEGPEYFKVFELLWYYNSEGNSPRAIRNSWNGGKIEQHIKKDQWLCYSKAKFDKIIEEENKQEIIKASNEMKQIIEPFKEMCKNIGYKEGTEKFADCVKDLYLKKLDAKNQSQTQSQTTITAVPKKKIDPSVWNDLLNISKGMSEGKTFTESLGSVGSSSSSSSKIQCFKSGERISGTNKICSYNCMGSEVVQNISSTSICALSIDLN